MKSKSFIFLLFPLLGFGQVQDTQTFSLQDVVSAISPSENSLSECFGDAVSSCYNSTYYSVYYSDWGNKNNLLMFRDYTCGGTVKYGYLYNWYAATDARNIAPAGWHVPTANDYLNLATELGATYYPLGDYYYVEYPYSVMDIDYWTTTQTGNTTRLSLRASGLRDNVTGEFRHIFGDLTEWSTWEGTWCWAYDLPGGLLLEFYGDINNFSLIFNAWTPGEYTWGVSIRLIKDDSTDPGIMTGNDGRAYTTVKIGSQVWMAENLAETKYRDGSTIPTVTDGATWAGLTTGAKCAYDNNESNVLK